MILFTDPADSFLADGSHDPERIQFFLYEEKGDYIRDDLAERFNFVFEYLEHQLVLGELPAITVAELNLYLTPRGIAGAMHGLWLRYIEHPGQHTVSPRIEVTPVIFLQSPSGAWVRVESGRDRSFELPHKYSELNKHLQEVQDEASELLRRINDYVEIKLVPSGIDSHYQDKNSFERLKGVKNLRSFGHYQDFLIVTGEQTHFMKVKPSIANCRHHNWKYSNQEGCAEPRLFSIQRRSTNIDHRSFFIDGENHHCTHRDVAIKKSYKIPVDMLEMCGSRSGGNHAPFCEIWAFEQYLCCRVCVFEKVCTNSQIFNLPCTPRE